MPNKPGGIGVNVAKLSGMWDVKKEKRPRRHGSTTGARAPEFAVSWGHHNKSLPPLLNATAMRWFCGSRDMLGRFVRPGREEE